MSVSVHIRRLKHAADLPLPAYATPGAAGMDLYAAMELGTRLVLPPGGRTVVPTGISVAIPPGYEMQIRPRSGLALKHGIMVANAPGTVDSDFRGEVGVILLNAGSVSVTISRGERIAQAVIAPVARAEWVEVAELEDTERGAGGFGSTGAR